MEDRAEDEMLQANIIAELAAHEATESRAAESVSCERIWRILALWCMQTLRPNSWHR